jgi:small redox-active disulfide protein 2
MVAIRGGVLVKLIQVLGPGCRMCEKLARNAERAVNELGIDATVERVSDISAIMAIGALMTPALAIDGEVRMVGKVPGSEEIKKLLV